MSLRREGRGAGGGLHGLEVLVLLIEHPQVLRTIGLGKKKQKKKSIRRRVANIHRRVCKWFVAQSKNLERRLADQTLVDDRPDAPQVGFGIVVLGHNDLWRLRERRSRIKISERGDTLTGHFYSAAAANLDTHTHTVKGTDHVHG